ncbi:MAG: hypothetical protein JEZ09_04045 [Salinivirgaceae bacterium]|nr:hypothetical protein [Salinivirgaceae bacterium]
MKVVKYIIAVVFALISVQNYTQAQSYGNEWINLNQSYYRFSIPHSGIYRVTGEELQNSGIMLGNFNPQNVQLFYKGEEIPCYIEGESQGLITFIEFYAEKNDGWFDIEMHENPESQTNPNYSFINDTASVFFTWNSSFNNLRFSNENDVNFSAYSPASYCMATSRVDYTSTYKASYEDSEYIKGEGWVDDAKTSTLSLGKSITKLITTPSFVNNGIKTTYDFSYITFSSGYHHIITTAPQMVFDTNFQSYTTINHRESVLVNSLNETTAITFSSIIDENSSETDYSLVSYIEITYPRTFNISKSQFFEFGLPASPAVKTYVELVDFVYDGEPYLYDLTRGSKIKLVADGTKLKALVPSSSQPLKMLLIDENYIFNTSQISNVSLVDYSAVNNEYIIISHPKLWEEAQNYAAYRNAYLVNVEKLYNQFGYGINKHPMAIRNFLNYIYNTWETQPKYLFIIGKGISAEVCRNNPSIYQASLIPPMGYPASDILLSNKIGNTAYENAIPTGRIAAQSLSDVSNYFNKVIEFESNEPQEWMKHAIHFGGGKSEAEQSAFKVYLKSFENSFTDTLFGGYVSTFLKTSSDPIATSKSDSIENLINGGISLMTFFGHGSTTGFDQNIDEPSAYNNTGKYPLMIANSCYSGNIFTHNAYSTSELWALIPNKGVIAYFAMVGQGTASYLYGFTNEFYKNLSVLKYGESLGDIINTTRKNIQLQYSPGRTLKSTIQLFTLHGDPKIVLNSFELPDLVMEKKYISFTPSILTTEIDSFSVNIIVTNISRSISENFSVELIRVFQDGSEEIYAQPVNGILFKDTIQFKLPIDRKRGQGVNQFLVTLDRNYQINELNENNNTSTTNYFISSTDLFPLIPYKYSIIPDNNITLKAATGDPFAKNQLSIFQLDTSYHFNSPELITEEISHDGGIIEWNTNQLFEKDICYFWRTAKKELNDEELKWSSSSFVFENGKSGWKQNNFGQIIENERRFIEADLTDDSFIFSEVPLTLRFKNIGRDSPNYDGANIGYTIGNFGDYAYCQEKAAIHVVIIDSSSMDPWKSDYLDYGQSNYPNCIGRYAYYLIYHLDNVEVALDKILYLIDDIPEGYYVLMYTIIDGKYSQWKERHFEAFQDWGADLPRYLFNRQPYVLFFQKGNLDKTQEWSGNSDETISGEIDIKSNFIYGTIKSPLIGPAAYWENLSCSVSSVENNINEVNFVNLIGIDKNANEFVLLDSLNNSTYDISDIDVNEYPYLKLEFYTKDEEFKTPGQLDFWEVTFSPVSDVAINPQRGWSFYNDTLQEGDKGTLTIPFENIGASKIDSLLVHYWFQDSKNIEHTLEYKRLKPLNAGDVIFDTINFTTLGYQGNNSIWVEINPENPNSKSFDQPEMHHFNNIAQKPFFVEKDQSNPILDVTFDGVHIMNDDLVSAKPEIVIQLSDENIYIPLNDTSLLSFYIKTRNTGIEEKILITNNPEVTFIEAQLPNNKAQLIYNHEFVEDGVYELRVRGKDQSGNESGSFDYTISFKVINESTITNVFNYPNPFSTSTRFVFELTGYELPDEMRIDILTVSGKLVKVIYLNDLGNLTIGKNITDYAWDGTDMFGDALANGVYFYRVFSKINGQNIKNRDTNTNQYFKNGFGKIYLIR